MKRVAKEALEQIMAFTMVFYWIYAISVIAEQGITCIGIYSIEDAVLMAAWISSGILGVWKEVNNVKTFLGWYEEAKSAGLIAD